MALLSYILGGLVALAAVLLVKLYHEKLEGDRMRKGELMRRIYTECWKRSNK